LKEKAGGKEMGSLQEEVKCWQGEVERLQGEGESSEKVEGEEEDQEVGNPALILV
jgi:hypothetical protein